MVTQTTQNVVEQSEGKQYTVDPDLTKDDVILWLKHSAAMLQFPQIYEQYGCDEEQCKDFAYLPLIPRTANQKDADHFNRKYAFGIMVCLKHHTIRPACQGDVDDFKAGRLKFLWLEWLREDALSRNGRGKLMPYPQELGDTITKLRKSGKIDRKTADEIKWVLGS